MAELHSYYPSSPSDKRKKASKSGKYIIQRKRDEIKEGPPALTPQARCPPAHAPPLVLGWNFPTAVAAWKSITAWSHFSMESSSETFTCRNLPALHPVAFPTIFQRVLCRSLNQLQWRKRCSHVWATLLPPPPHHQHLWSSRCPNRCRYVPTGACPDFSR